MQSAQAVYQFLLYSFIGWMMFFILVIFFIEIKYHPDDSFYVKPIAKGFVKTYIAFFLLAIIFNYKLFF